MDWLNDLNGSVVALDTAPVIYFIEKNPIYVPLVMPFFEAMDQGRFRVVTSTLTLAEVLVHPFRVGSVSLAERYFQILTTSRNLDILPVSEMIAVEVARLRAESNLKAPDAIQLATARISGATSFLTNDAGIRQPSDIRMLVLKQLVTR